MDRACRGGNGAGNGEWEREMHVFSCGRFVFRARLVGRAQSFYRMEAEGFRGCGGMLFM